MTTNPIDPESLVSGCYVAVVEVKGDHVPARYRRRIFLSLAPAQKSVDLATMNGLEAHIGLYRLVPAGEAE